MTFKFCICHMEEEEEEDGWGGPRSPSDGGGARAQGSSRTLRCFLKAEPRDDRSDVAEA